MNPPPNLKPIKRTPPPGNAAPKDQQNQLCSLSHEIVKTDHHHCTRPLCDQPQPPACKHATTTSSHEPTTKPETNKKEPPLLGNAAPKDPPNQLCSLSHEIVKTNHHQPRLTYDQPQPTNQKPIHNPIPQILGKLLMSESNEDSPGMEFITNMVRGQEKIVSTQFSSARIALVSDPV